MNIEEIKFWETGGMATVRKVKNQPKHTTGANDLKQVFSFTVHGIFGENRHDITIGNKWSYMSDDEKLTWKEQAKLEIFTHLKKQLTE